MKNKTFTPAELEILTCLLHSVMSRVVYDEDTKLFKFDELITFYPEDVSLLNHIKNQLTTGV